MRRKETEGVLVEGVNLKNAAIGKTEVFMPAYPGDRKIFKRTDSEGNVTFHSECGGELGVCPESLYDTWHLLFVRLREFGGLLDELENGEMGELITTITYCYRNMILRETLQFEEIFRLLELTIGEIEIDYIHDRSADGTDRPVNARIIPPDHENKNEVLTHEVDPDLVDLLKSINPSKACAVRSILSNLARGGDINWYPVTSAKE